MMSQRVLRSLLRRLVRKAQRTLILPRYRRLTREAFIPLVELLLGPNRKIRKGRYAGIGCYYKTALLNTLIRLRPKVCLEIGTHYGGTTRVFEYYFRKYEPLGILITTDVRKYTDLATDKVRPVIVYPHVTNISDYHDICPDQMLPDFDVHLHDSVEANCEILRGELSKIGADAFDFCFVDGDHQGTSFLRDLKIVRMLSHSPHFALLDDTKDEIHESASVYQERLVNKVDHYDFNDWPIFVGASLVWY